MNLEDLKARLREDLGNPTTTQLTDKQAENAVNAAINEYSKYRPIKVLDYIGTNKDKAIYSLSDRQGIMRVKTVYYNPSGFSFDVDFKYLGDPTYAAQEGRLEGISLFDNPSIWLQYTQRLEQYKAMFEGSFDYDRENKILRLIPPPSTDGVVVYFIWTKRHTPETLPEEEIDDILLWAKAVGKEAMSSSKTINTREIKSVSGFGQSVTLGSSAETLTKESKDLKDDFRKKFGGGSTIIIG